MVKAKQTDVSGNHKESDSMRPYHLLILTTKVFGSFLLYVGMALRLNEKDIASMPQEAQLEIYDKKSAGTKIEPLTQADEPFTSGHGICTALQVQVSKWHML